MEFLGIHYTDWMGYSAMAISFGVVFNAIFHTLRMVNAIGCLLFVIYGVVLTPISKPIIITNVAIFCINLYYLLKTEK